MSFSDAREFWEEKYAGEQYRFGVSPNAFLAAHVARLKPGLRALALADGEGRNGVWLARQGLEVVSVDISRRGIAKANALAAAHGVELDTRQGDLSAWDMGEAAFDVVVAIFIQFAGPDLRARLFAGIKRALRPGGLLILQGYRPEQIEYGTGGPPFAENMYTEELLRDAFGDFEIEHLESHDDVIHEGSGHDGLSALIDLTARKPVK
jgi:SAM-dependent methyltransferase